MPPQQIIRSIRNTRHSTSIDVSVIGLLVQTIAKEIDGIHEAQLEKAMPLLEGEVNGSEQTNQQETPTRFDEHAHIVLTVKLVPYLNEQISAVSNTFRTNLIERIQQLTDMKVHAVHINIAGLAFR